MANVELSVEEVRRYGRHLIMPEVGMDGQKKLKAASVLLIGAGGLGSPLGLYLAAAGVGRIGIVDFDCRRLFKFAATSPVFNKGCRKAETRIGKGTA